MARLTHVLAIAGLAVLAGAPAPARSATEAAAAEREAALRLSFETFAADWIAGERARLAAERPRLHVAEAGPVARYRSLGPGYTVELRPSGSPEAPFFAVLHLSERLHQCRDVRARECPVVREKAESLLFRRRGESWGY